MWGRGAKFFDLQFERGLYFGTQGFAKITKLPFMLYMKEILELDDTEAILLMQKTLSIGLTDVAT